MNASSKLYAFSCKFTTNIVYCRYMARVNVLKYSKITARICT